MGLIKTYRVYYTDGTTYDFEVADGEQGETGAAGQNGVNGVDGQSYVMQSGHYNPIGVTDGIYTDGTELLDLGDATETPSNYGYIVYNNTDPDDPHYQLVHSNGEDWEVAIDYFNGIKGETGVGISSIEYTGRMIGMNGMLIIDEYVITYTDGGTFEYSVPRGERGNSVLTSNISMTASSYSFYYVGVLSGTPMVDDVVLSPEGNLYKVTNVIYEPLISRKCTVEFWYSIKGEKGDKGDKGDTGAQGAAGTNAPVLYVHYIALSTSNPSVTLTIVSKQSSAYTIAGLMSYLYSVVGSVSSAAAGFPGISEWNDGNVGIAVAYNGSSSIRVFFNKTNYENHTISGITDRVVSLA
jgi:hypothetical protein